MKKQALVSALLSGSLLLTGCSSMLSRSYSSVTTHSATPTVESDQLTIRVESYQDLVDALLYFVNQGRETGTIRLYNYPYDVDQDLASACMEVALEEPMGAYALENIRYDVTPIVSCYEAEVEMSYRRTPKQISAVIPATGATAIRGELGLALSSFQKESVLRISYFDVEDGEQYLRGLLWDAYLSSPETALDFPQATISFYPENGRHRIAEILLKYTLDDQELQQQKAQLAQLAEQLAAQLTDTSGNEGLLAVRNTILGTASYAPDGGQTAYHALAEHKANSLGLSLTMALLCQELNLSCQLVEGTKEGNLHYWTILSTQDGYRHLDLSQTLAAGESPFRSDRYMAEHGYHWDSDSMPLCGEQPVS